MMVINIARQACHVSPFRMPPSSALRRVRGADRQFNRSRPSACRWRKKGGEDHAIGRSRGGLSTKINAAVDENGLPVRLLLTAGQAHDLRAAKRTRPSDWNEAVGVDPGAEAKVNGPVSVSIAAGVIGLPAILTETDPATGLVIVQTCL